MVFTAAHPRDATTPGARRGPASVGVGSASGLIRRPRVAAGRWITRVLRGLSRGRGGIVGPAVPVIERVVRDTLPRAEPTPLTGATCCPPRAVAVVPAPGARSRAPAASPGAAPGDRAD